MSRRTLGTRSPNWSGIINNHRAKSCNRLDRGEYEWQIVVFDKNDKRKSDQIIRADDFDQAVKKAMDLIRHGERVTVDGRSFTK